MKKNAGVLLGMTPCRPGIDPHRNAPMPDGDRWQAGFIMRKKKCFPQDRLSGIPQPLSIPPTQKKSR